MRKDKVQRYIGLRIDVKANSIKAEIINEFGLITYYTKLRLLIN